MILGTDNDKYSNCNLCGSTGHMVTATKDNMSLKVSICHDCIKDLGQFSAQCLKSAAIDFTKITNNERNPFIIN